MHLRMRIGHVCATGVEFTRAQRMFCLHVSQARGDHTGVLVGACMHGTCAGAYVVRAYKSGDTNHVLVKFGLVFCRDLNTYSMSQHIHRL